MKFRSLLMIAVAASAFAASHRNGPLLLEDQTANLNDFYIFRSYEQGKQNKLVGINAVEGLSDYRDPVVVPYLLSLAKNGGLVGTAALDRALTFGDPRVLETARALINSKDVSDKLAAMRVIGAMGDETDIPALRKIQANETGMVSAAGRGFGLIPAISLSRAAQTTIEKIGERTGH